MNEILDYIFYNNTVYDWLLALLFILSSYVAAKLIYLIANRFVKRLTVKTKTKIDDLIIDMVQEPLTFGLIVLGFWLAVSNLVLPENVYLYIHKILYVLITFDVSWLLVRLIDSILTEYLHPFVMKSESTLDDHLFPILRKTVKFVLWSIAIIVGLNNAGYDVGALIAGLGLGGLAFAMAAKDTLANLLGGITIFLDKPFKIKDRIQIDTYDGTVSEIGLRSTRLNTLEGRVVTIPNLRFASDIITNVSAEPTLKVVSNIGLTFDTTAQQIEHARNIIKSICLNNPGVEDEIIVSFNEFKASELNLLYIYYIKKESDINEIKNQINIEILRQFNDAGLQFAFPTLTVHSKKAE